MSTEGVNQHGVVVLFILVFVLFLSMLQFSLSTFIFPLTSRDDLSVVITLIPASLSQREAVDVGFSLVCLHLSVGSRVSSCVCVLLAVLKHKLSNTEATRRISHDQFFSQSSTTRISLTGLKRSHLTGQNPILMGFG